MQNSQPDFLKFFAYRLAYTRGLLNLMQTQEEAIVEQDMPKLLEILSHKQTIINEIDNQQKSFPSWQETWEEHRDSIPQTDRGQCEQLFHESQRLLAELLQMEQDNISRLSHQRDAVLEQLETVSAVAQNHQAYFRNEDSSASLLDLNQ